MGSQLHDYIALFRPARMLTILQAFVLAAALSPFCFSQSFTSSITGKVNDATGAGVPNAKIELKNMATNDVRDYTTQSDGSYQFSNLIPGTYQMTATASGFKTYVQQNLVLQAQIATSVNMTLEVGGTQEKVEVTAAATLVDTETANNVVTMESRLIEDLPNGTRSPLNFVFSLAGHDGAPGGQSGKFQFTDQLNSNFGLNGGRTGEASILIDGAPSQAVDWGGMLVSPLQDSVQEQQIVVNTYDAQYERGGAGIVTLITKGGTNEFHGEAYDYLQNSYFNANCWACNKYGSPRGQYKQNQFGGNFGGPLVKRWNLFFFGGYEGLRQPNSQNSGLLSVPTEAERNGDFSQSLMVNPDGVTASPVTLYNPVFDYGGHRFRRQRGRLHAAAVRRKPDPVLSDQSCRPEDRRSLSVAEPGAENSGHRYRELLQAGRRERAQRQDGLSHRLGAELRASRLLPLLGSIPPEQHVALLLLQRRRFEHRRHQSRMAGRAERHRHAKPDLGHQLVCELRVLA